ncbi:hypothetical protein [Staphylococcus succinus]|uniref:hypothetical protein n=1 Tax=Staphylococcus succinus TaxID=61015 RepID=UPI00115ECDCC|nr:hypothetical protein [Staphylococcus succinus]
MNNVEDREIVRGVIVVLPKSYIYKDLIGKRIASKYVNNIEYPIEITHLHYSKLNADNNLIMLVDGLIA